MSVESLNRQVNQSCGRHTAAVASACAGSLSTNHRSLLAVIAATGTTPTRFAHSPGPPSSSTSWEPLGADRVSFHSNASRTTAPDRSRHTIPCCCAPTATASTSSSPPTAAIVVCSAVHQCCGAISVPPGWGVDADLTTLPLSASQTTILHDWVDESIPATRATTRSYTDTTDSGQPFGTVAQPTANRFAAAGLRNRRGGNT